MPLDELAPEILAFVDRYIDRFASWDVLAFFHENPEERAGVDVVAERTGRRPSAVAPVLELLTNKGVLTCERGESESPAYRYNASPEFRSNMEAFMTATRDRANRLALVGLILRKEAKQR